VRGGVAAPSPSAPGVDAEWTASVLLATIDIPAAAADITACTITDERAMSQLVVDATTLEGNTAADFAAAVHDHDADYADLAHVATTDEHPVATTGAAGFLSAGDKSKLDGIETSADANRSAAELLTDIKTVDGSGSLIDADLLDGTHASGLDLLAHDHYSRYYTEGEEAFFLLYKSGLVQWVNIRKTSSQSIPNNAYTDVTLDSDIVDDWGGHSGSDARVDCDDDGLYLIEVQVQFQTASAGSYRHIEIYHAVDGGIAQNRTGWVSGGQTLLQVQTVYQMATGEGVKIRVKHDYGSAINVDGTNTWLRMTKLGGYNAL
jgi:hypothetical protein